MNTIIFCVENDRRYIHSVLFYKVRSVEKPTKEGERTNERRNKNFFPSEEKKKKLSFASLGLFYYQSFHPNNFDWI